LELAGKVNELRNSVDHLASELEAQRQKYKALQERYITLVKKQSEVFFVTFIIYPRLRTNEIQAADISLSGHLLTTHILDQIMKRYNDHIYPFIHVATPFQDFNFMQEKEGTPCSKNKI